MTQEDFFSKALRRTALFFSRNYFRAEVRGLSHIPEGPCLLVGNHNCIGVVNPEIWIFGAHYLSDKKRRPLKALGHDIVTRIPVASALSVKYLGYIPNNSQAAVQSLKEGNNVLVYPGGGWESCRPSSERDRIDFKNRSGFVKVARAAGVPIVPVVSSGAHDGVYIWRRGHRIAKWLGLHRLFRIDAFPIGLSFPFLIHVGPLFPFFPLPRKVKMEILPPVFIEKDLNDVEIAQKIVSMMQETLTSLR